MNVKAPPTDIVVIKKQTAIIHLVLTIVNVILVGMVMEWNVIVSILNYIEIK